MKSSVKISIIIAIVAGFAFLLITAWEFSFADSTDEEDAIREAVQLYVDGVKFSDTSLLESAFHEDWHMTGFYQDGVYQRFNRDRFIRMIATNRQRDRDNPAFEGGILEIRQHGRAATAKIHLENNRVIYTDYLSLIKINGEWTIIHKIWDTVSKQ